jgi:hypothetical protein
MQRARRHDREHAAPRRHAAPHLQTCIEARDSDEGLDAVVDARRSARPRVAPAAPTSTAAAVTPPMTLRSRRPARLSLGPLRGAPTLVRARRAAVEVGSFRSSPTSQMSPASDGVEHRAMSTPRSSRRSSRMFASTRVATSSPKKNPPPLRPAGVSRQGVHAGRGGGQQPSRPARVGNARPVPPAHRSPSPAASAWRTRAPQTTTASTTSWPTSRRTCCSSREPPLRGADGSVS